jgi:DNA-directed RNA polymerase subunit H (RpoH/RPB5)
MKPEEAEKLLVELNIALSQLPKIKAEDPALPPNCKVGDVIKIERKSGEKTILYYRVVI